MAEHMDPAVQHYMSWNQDVSTRFFISFSAGKRTNLGQKGPKYSFFSSRSVENSPEKYLVVDVEKQATSITPVYFFCENYSTIQRAWSGRTVEEHIV